MTKRYPLHTIQDVMSWYENYKIKVDGKWYFITRDKLYSVVKGSRMRGRIVKKRTRVWIE